MFRLYDSLEGTFKQILSQIMMALPNIEILHSTIGAVRIEAGASLVALVGRLQFWAIGNLANGCRTGSG